MGPGAPGERFTQPPFQSPPRNPNQSRRHTETVGSAIDHAIASSPSPPRRHYTASPRRRPCAPRRRCVMDVTEATRRYFSLLKVYPNRSTPRDPKVYLTLVSRAALWSGSVFGSKRRFRSKIKRKKESEIGSHIRVQKNGFISNQRQTERF